MVTHSGPVRLKSPNLGQNCLFVVGDRTCMYLLVNKLTPAYA